MAKKISIVIPCYNASEYLPRAFTSLEKQTIGMEALECIFVNDASIDDGKTSTELETFEKKYPESVLVVNLSENVGPGEARNIGIGYASGKYLEFFDADDELRDDCCEKLFEAAEINNADIVQFNHLYISDKTKKSSGDSTESRLYKIDDHDDRLPFLNASIVTYGCTNKLYSLEFVRNSNVRFPSKVRYEEPLFVYPLFLYAKRVYLLNEDLYLYYFNQGSMITSMLGKNVLDHPTVQLMLLEDLMKRTEMYEQYRDIIGIYFMWSFYCETILFTANNADAKLPLDYFRQMQTVCKTFFGDWDNNRYINMIPQSARTVIKSVYRSFGSQEELDRFIIESRDLL